MVKRGGGKKKKKKGILKKPSSIKTMTVQADFLNKNAAYTCSIPSSTTINILAKHTYPMNCA